MWPFRFGCSKALLAKLKPRLSEDMPIPGSDLSRWCHPRSAMASKQAHVSIRDALAADDRLSEFRYGVFLQGSYKNNTNLRKDSDVDLVVRLAYKLSPSVTALSGTQLQENP